MKFRIYLKDPDGFYQSVADVAGNDPDKERFLYEFMSRWVSFKEYVTIEFDTDAGTAAVVEDEKL